MIKCPASMDASQMTWDVFISHATEDKSAVAEPLANALKDAGLSVWYDRFELLLGDRLRRKIDEGLLHSRYGIVILSHSFFKKHWPQVELDGLAQREIDGEKVILPIWYELTGGDVRTYSPTLADRLATSWSTGLENVVHEVLAAVRQVGWEGEHGRTAMHRPTPQSKLDTRTLRVGLSCGLLKESGQGQVSLTARYVKSLCREAKEVMEKLDPARLDNLWEDAFLGGSLKGKDRTQIVIGDFEHFLDSIGRTMVMDYMIQVGIKSHLFSLREVDGKLGFEFNKELLEEFFIMCTGIQTVDEVEGYIARSCVQLARPRLLLHDPARTDHSHLAGLFLFLLFKLDVYVKAVKMAVSGELFTGSA
jgi:TIR domain